MMLTPARQLAMKLMREHDLTKWSFSFNKNKRRLGVCRYKKKSIELSRYFVTANDEDTIKDIILHEIAHALVGTGQGHNNVWKQKAVDIGCSPSRTKSVITDAPHKFFLWCNNCGQKTPIYRQRKRTAACGFCCKKYNNGRYTDKYKLEQVEE